MSPSAPVFRRALSPGQAHRHRETADHLGTIRGKSVSRQTLKRPANASKSSNHLFEGLNDCTSITAARALNCSAIKTAETVRWRSWDRMESGIDVGYPPSIKRPRVLDALSAAVASGFRLGANRSASASASCLSASRIPAGSSTSACTP